MSDNNDDDSYCPTLSFTEKLIGFAICTAIGIILITNYIINN